MTNTDLLNEIINDSGYKREYIAKTLGLTAYGLSKKINNKTEFKSSEISALCEILNIDDLELKERIFFVTQVDFKSINERM